MYTHSTALNFSSTGAFTQIAMDYVSGATQLRPFYKHRPDKAGILAAMDERRKFAVNRGELVRTLRQQYQDVPVDGRVTRNIDALLHPNTFTVTTAHQNNLFTGPLYFIYKILHVVKIAEELSGFFPADQFVPVYYMGSEDADLEELDHINIAGEKISWNTSQLGAVGRMTVDRQLLGMIDTIEGQVAVTSAGVEIMQVVRSCYREGERVQDATFLFVNRLLGEFGVVVLIPDDAGLKRTMLPIFRDDLLNQTPSAIVQQTATSLGKLYKVQAHPRDINLFYLDEQVRERIEKEGDEWKVKRIEKKSGRAELLQELEEHPERFSPNVILRGLYQETILPNIVFAGGGGELAYWLELKDLFEHYKVPMPVLLLRNSFLIASTRQAEKWKALGFSLSDLFRPSAQLLNQLVRRDSEYDLSMARFVEHAGELYTQLGNQAGKVDPSLVRHVDALRAKTIYRLEQVGKKMLRAEKRKFADQERQLNSLKSALFPGNNLQERKENILPYLAKWGMQLIDALYQASPGIEPGFTILECGDEDKPAHP